MTEALAFELPERLEAHEPPPRRDDVRMLVAASGADVVHARFRDLPRILAPGDVLVVNTSATLPAALTAIRSIPITSRCSSGQSSPAHGPSWPGSSPGRELAPDHPARSLRCDSRIRWANQVLANDNFDAFFDALPSGHLSVDALFA